MISGGEGSGDGVRDFTEFALNGNPTTAASVDLIDYTADNTLQQLVYTRHIDGAATYLVETTTNLVSGGWATNDVIRCPLPAGTIDVDYKAVTNRVDATGGQDFLRLLIGQ